MKLPQALIYALALAIAGGAALLGAPEQARSAGTLASITRTRPASRVHYCERWPNRCNVTGTCAATSGCWPMIYACCQQGLGCWAVATADACPDTADLYPFNCEAGESAVDPTSGESIIICHD